MSSPRPFGPSFGSNQVVTIGAAGNQSRTVNVDNFSLRVYNSGAGDLYVRAYSSQQTPTPVASNVDYPVAPGTASVMNIGPLDRVSLFSTAGTTAQIMTGDGGT